MEQLLTTSSFFLLLLIPIRYNGTYIEINRMRFHLSDTKKKETIDRSMSISLSLSLSLSNNNILFIVYFRRLSLQARSS